MPEYWLQEKKMSASEIATLSGFYPAVVRTTTRTGYYIDYYVYDPVNDRMVRRIVQLKRLLCRFRTNREKQLAAQRIADEINRKLGGGWTPLHETEDGRLYTTIAELRERFLSAKEREGVRPATMAHYSSFTSLFLRWCEDSGRGRKYSGTFLRVDAVHYMDYVLERGNGNRSYNNTLKALRCFFNWAVEHCYAKENPFDGLKLLPKQPKKRGLVDAGTRARIADYFRREKPQMLLVCLLVYSSAIRPKEISLIQLKHVRLADRCILIEGENAKNHKARCATLTREAIDMLVPLLQRYTDSSLYLFGAGREMLPGVRRALPTYFTKCWVRMRDDLRLPDSMQLYSLRDTGLSDLLHAGVDQLTVQHHADHSSLAIQNIYTDHFDPGLNERIFTMAPEF